MLNALQIKKERNMSWIYGYLCKTPERIVNRIDRPAELVYQTPVISVYAPVAGKKILGFPHPLRPEEQVFILGDPIIPHGEDFHYPDLADWKWVLANESSIHRLEGHWLILIASASGIRAYNDALCKRSLYIHESPERIFFCSDISLIKEAGLAELDPQRFGAYWHTMFPPNVRKYAPSSQSWYKGISMLFQGGCAELSISGVRLMHRPFSPSSEPANLHKQIENMTLLPLQAGRRVCVGLSGGMDIRPLLAIMLKSGFPFDTVHFGVKDTWDYRIAQRIARDFHLPFRFIGHREVSLGWESAVVYLHQRGFGFNPASNCLMGYHPIIAEAADVFLGGRWGELLRFRFMAAHMKSLIKPSGLDAGTISAYLYNQPESFFVPEIDRIMRDGFFEALNEAVSLMPDSRGMANPLWLDLFYARYSLRSIDLPDLSNLDACIVDHMPYLQHSIMSQHWHCGLFQQLREGIHRKIIRDNAPGLQHYPLAIADAKAPYYFPPYAMKLVAKLQRKKVHTATITEQFLAENEANIRALLEEKRVKEDPWLDLPKLRGMVAAFYAGDKARQNAVLSFISYVLGK